MLIHITSGRGPTECELAVGKFLTALGLETKIEILAREDGKYHGCVKSSVVLLRDDVSPICGAVQWICKSPLRLHCNRKNWFIGVTQIEEPQDCLYESGSGIIFQTFRSGGNGGQHVNKTESAVRAIHVATGITAVCQDERSQRQNKNGARARLLELLEEKRQEIEIDGRAQLFLNNNNVVRGNPVRTYEGISFRRILIGGVNENNIEI